MMLMYVVVVVVDVNGWNQSSYGPIRAHPFSRVLPVPVRGGAMTAGHVPNIHKFLMNDSTRLYCTITMEREREGERTQLCGRIPIDIIHACWWLIWLGRAVTSKSIFVVVVVVVVVVVFVKQQQRQDETKRNKSRRKARE